jgi:hypothetical protein
LANTERFQLRLAPDIKEALAAQAGAAGVSINDVILTALEQFLAPAAPEAPPLVAATLAGLGEQLLSLEIKLETFIQVILRLVPPVPADQHQVYNAKGAERHQRFTALYYDEMERVHKAAGGA